MDFGTRCFFRVPCKNRTSLHFYFKPFNAVTYHYHKNSNKLIVFIFSATIEINGVEYGKGLGSSKKIAKSEAARLTLEILIPEFKKVETKNGSIIQKNVDESVSLMTEF